jgi:hypothetical protein
MLTLINNEKMVHETSLRHPGNPLTYITKRFQTMLTFHMNYNFSSLAELNNHQELQQSIPYPNPNSLPQACRKTLHRCQYEIIDEITQKHFETFLPCPKMIAKLSSENIRNSRLTLSKWKIH